MTSSWRLCAGGERLGERDGGLVQLAGVVGVGVERGDREGSVVAADANALPVERGGDLQRDAGERRFAVVADGERGRGRRSAASAGRRCTSRSKAVKVTAWRSASCGGGHVDRSAAGGVAAGPDCGGGLAVLVGGAGEDDLALVGLGSLRRRRSGRAWVGGGFAPRAGKLSRRERLQRQLRKRGRDENFMNPGLSVSLVWTQRRRRGRAACGACRAA